MKYYVPIGQTKEDLEQFIRERDKAQERVYEFIRERLGIESRQFHVDQLAFFPADEETPLPRFMTKDRDGVWRLRLNTREGKAIHEEFKALETMGYSVLHFFERFLTTTNHFNGSFSWHFDMVKGEYALVSFKNIDVDGLVAEGRFIEKSI